MGSPDYKLSHVHRRQVISELLLRIRPPYHHIFFMMINDDSFRTEKKVMTFIFIWKKIIFRALKYNCRDIIKQVKMTKKPVTATKINYFGYLRTCGNI